MVSTAVTQQGMSQQLRRGTSTQLSVFVGAVGEPNYITDMGRLAFHDGVTVGGWQAESVSVAQYFGSTASTGGVIPADVTAVYVWSTVTFSLRLPTIASYPVGQFLSIFDAQRNGCTVAVSAASGDAMLAVTGSSVSAINLVSTGGGVMRLMVNSTYPNSPITTPYWVGNYLKGG